MKIKQRLICIAVAACLVPLSACSGTVQVPDEGTTRTVELGARPSATVSSTTSSSSPVTAATATTSSTAVAVEPNATPPATATITDGIAADKVCVLTPARTPNHPQWNTYARDDKLGTSSGTDRYYHKRDLLFFGGQSTPFANSIAIQTPGWPYWTVVVIGQNVGPFDTFIQMADTDGKIKWLPSAHVMTDDSYDQMIKFWNTQWYLIATPTGESPKVPACN